MLVAVSGSHSTGKSTLIDAFVGRRPRYVYEPEAFEVLADDIALTPSEGPDSEGLAALLMYTISLISSHRAGGSVIFERSPVDYLAYAAASRSMAPAERTDFLRGHIPRVRDSLRHLDLIVLLPVSSEGPLASRPGEDECFRSRVDDMLRRALIDDEYALFEDSGAPAVVELSPDPDRQLTELMRRTCNA